MVAGVGSHQVRATHGVEGMHKLRFCLDLLCYHCLEQANTSGATRACILLLRSPASWQCCRLLKAGEEVLWHEEWEAAVDYTLFDGKGGVKTINVEQATMVDFLLSGTVRSMQIR